MPENYDEKLNMETFGDADENSAPTEVFTDYFTPAEVEKIAERKKLKKAANLAGISLILVLVVSFLFSIPTAILSFLGYDFLQDSAVLQCYQALFSLFSFTVPFILCYKIGGFRISELMSFSKTDKKVSIPLFFFGIAFCSFANIGSSAIDSFFSSFGIDYGIGELNFPDGVFGFILTTIAIAAVPALVEEFALRGIVLGSLRKFGDVFALIVSAICFGIMHGNFEQMPFAFAVGLFLGFTVIKTGSMRVAILLHFFNNFVSVVFSYFPQSVTTEVLNITYVFFLLCCLILGIWSLSKTDTSVFALSDDNKTVFSEKEKYKIFFLSAGIVAFIIVNLIEAVSYILL